MKGARVAASWGNSGARDGETDSFAFLFLMFFLLLAAANIAIQHPDHIEIINIAIKQAQESAEGQGLHHPTSTAVAPLSLLGAKFPPIARPRHRDAKALGVVVEGRLLLGLDDADALHIVFMLENRPAAAEREHAGLDANGLREPNQP